MLLYYNINIWPAELVYREFVYSLHFCIQLFFCSAAGGGPPQSLPKPPPKLPKASPKPPKAAPKPPQITPDYQRGSPDAFRAVFASSEGRAKAKKGQSMSALRD